MEENQITPKDQWKDLTLPQLYEVKTAMLNRYYSMRQINASFAHAYAQFVSELEALIVFRENEVTSSD